MNDLITYADAICTILLKLSAAFMLCCVAVAVNRFRKSVNTTWNYAITFPSTTSGSAVNWPVATTTATNIAKYTIEGSDVMVEKPAPKPVSKPPAAPAPPPPDPSQPVVEVIECGHCHNQIRSQPVHSEVREGQVTLVYVCETCKQRVSVAG